VTARSTPFTIRKAAAPEQAALIDIWRRATAASHNFLSEKDMRSLVPAVVDYLAGAHLELWLLCEEDGTTVGFMGLAAATVDSLFIVPESSRQGGGTLLISHARRLKGPLTVDVNEQNTGALRFYEQVGFHVIGRSPVDSAGRPFPLLHLREIPRRWDTSQKDFGTP
jgi:putative acetyltransferase